MISFLPINSGADCYRPSTAKDPAEMSYEWHGDCLQERLGGGEIHKVFVLEVWVIAVGVVVPHVGGEVGVDVRVAEV